MTITIAAVNDAPVAGNDAATTNEDTAVTIAVLANDTDVDGDVLAVTSAGTPLHGSTVANPDGTITYTPAANFNGADTFTYTISDGHGGTATASGHGGGRGGQRCAGGGATTATAPTKTRC